MTPAEYGAMLAEQHTAIYGPISEETVRRAAVIILNSMREAEAKG